MPTSEETLCSLSGALEKTVADHIDTLRDSMGPGGTSERLVRALILIHVRLAWSALQAGRKEGIPREAGIDLFRSLINEAVEKVIVLETARDPELARRH